MWKFAAFREGFAYTKPQCRIPVIGLTRTGFASLASEETVGSNKRRKQWKREHICLVSRHRWVSGAGQTWSNLYHTSTGNMLHFWILWPFLDLSSPEGLGTGVFPVGWGTGFLTEWWTTVVSSQLWGSSRLLLLFWQQRGRKIQFRWVRPIWKQTAATRDVNGGRVRVLRASQTRQMLCVSLFLFRFQFSAIPAPPARLPQLSGPTSSHSRGSLTAWPGVLPRANAAGEEGGPENWGKVEAAWGLQFIFVKCLFPRSFYSYKDNPPSWTRRHTPELPCTLSKVLTPIFSRGTPFVSIPTLPLAPLVKMASLTPPPRHVC